MSVIFCPDIIRIIVTFALEDLASRIKAVFADPFSGAGPDIVVCNWAAGMAGLGRQWRDIMLEVGGPSFLSGRFRYMSRPLYGKSSYQKIMMDVNPGICAMSRYRTSDNMLHICQQQSMIRFYKDITKVDAEENILNVYRRIVIIDTTNVYFSTNHMIITIASNDTRFHTSDTRYHACDTSLKRIKYQIGTLLSAISPQLYDDMINSNFQFPYDVYIGIGAHSYTFQGRALNF
jgi:hypothetical protein